MKSIPFDNVQELTPGAARVAARRLVSWLPLGPVAVVGGATVALTRSLMAYGVVVHHESVSPSGSACSGVILVPHRVEDAEGAASRLSTLLAEVDVPICLVIAGGAARGGSRVFWEEVMLALDWRKHPLNEVVAPYGELDRAVGLQLVAFERVPRTASVAYPLQSLIEGRGLHMDMSREAGKRSDARVARYVQAARFVKPGDRVIDVACGLGCGTYQIAHSCQAASFIGLDASEHAIEYAQMNFGSNAPVPMKFVLGDAQHLRDMDDASADFAVSVETLEHLPQPDLLLAELCRVLAPGGRIYASVSNDTADETGGDPHQFRFQVYSWARLKAQFLRNGFEIERAWLQDAGGGQNRPLSSRSMLEIDVEHGPPCDGEWLLVLARKKGGATVGELEPLARLRELLRLGSSESAAALLQRIDSSGQPLQAALAHAIQGWSLLSARSKDAATAWSNARHWAREALGDAAAEMDASDLLSLSVDVLRQIESGRLTAGVLGHLQARHALALQQVLGEPVAVDDLDDRAVVAGSQNGDENVNIIGREVRSLMEAKDWLDLKYHEHLKKISQLESNADELEQARRWLDDQYHALSAEVNRLAGNSGN